ncbi:MAG: lysine exporter LysO family protein [Desulfurococcaceae archaeon]|nr:lysine exporter LysO family protein [Sulfolobales archaeon]MDW8170718.1 lysine exporter LysO family protein [Desulfurococcaceae archaeon]
MKHVAIVTALFTTGVIVGFLNESIGVVSFALNAFLYLLIFIIGVLVVLEVRSVKFIASSLGLALRLAASTVVGSALGGAIVGALIEGSLKPYLAVALGMGWYTFTGPFLSITNNYWGLLGFTSNVLREAATFIIYPLLAKNLAIEAISIGGATTMDTTLPVIARYGGGEAALTALVHGFILTLLIPILVPLVMELP